MALSARTNLKEIPQRATYQYTERFSRESLDNSRLRGDLLADRIASELHSKHGGLTKIHDLLSTVREKAASLAGPEGDIFRDFLSQAASPPPWASRELIERGQRLHAVTYPMQGLSLFCGSLVGGAQFSSAAVVTSLAGNITDNPTRRINETGMLLSALALPGTLFSPGGAANDSLCRVRLLHGALRHWLPRSGRLEPHRRMVGQVYVEGEVPINQQDLAITLAVFCYINLRSLRRMGVVLRSGDIQAYVHMWRYAGWVLGIDEEFLPESVEAQEEFMLASMLHQGQPNIIPKAKTLSFIGEFAKDTSKNTRGLLPEASMNTFLQQLIVHLNGNENVAGVGIEDLGESHWSIRVAKAVGFLYCTVLPRLPLGESVLFRLHSGAVQAALRQRGTPVGHAAGSGKDLGSKL